MTTPRTTNSSIEAKESTQLVQVHDLDNRNWTGYQTSTGTSFYVFSLHDRKIRRRLDANSAKAFREQYQYFIEIDEKNIVCIAPSHVDICDTETLLKFEPQTIVNYTYSLPIAKPTKVFPDPNKDEVLEGPSNSGDAQFKMTQFKLYKKDFLLSCSPQKKELVFLNMTNGEVNRVGFNFEGEINNYGYIHPLPNNEKQILIPIHQKNEVLIVEFDQETAKVITKITLSLSEFTCVSNWDFSASAKFWSAEFFHASATDNEKRGITVWINNNFQLETLIHIPGANMLFWSNEDIVYLDEKNRVCIFDCANKTNTILKTLEIQELKKSHDGERQDPRIFLFHAVQKSKEILYRNKDSQVCVYDFMGEQAKARQQLQDALDCTPLFAPLKKLVASYVGNVNYLFYPKSACKQVDFPRELKLKTLIRERFKSIGWEGLQADCYILKKRILDMLLEHLISPKNTMPQVWQEVENGLSGAERKLLQSDKEFLKFIENIVAEAQIDAVEKLGVKMSS